MENVWPIFEDSQRRIQKVLFQVLQDHATARGFEVVSKELEHFHDGKPSLRCSDGYIYIADNSQIVEEGS